MWFIFDSLRGDFHKIQEGLLKPNFLECYIGGAIFLLVSVLIYPIGLGDLRTILMSCAGRFALVLRAESP